VREFNPTSQWEKVASLTPSMASHVFWTEQTQRGVTWYVLQNEATGEHARLNATSHAIISRLDGTRALEKVVSEVNALEGYEVDESDLLQLIEKLQRIGALVGCELIDSNELRQQHWQLNRKGRFKRWMNPLAVRVNLYDPDAFLTWVAPRFSALFNATTLWLWSIVLVLALYGLLTNWSEITQEFLTRTMRLQTLWWFAFLYPIMKVLHEFSHALCVKHWGGQVREVGVSLLLLIPVPYVDASDVHVMHSRHQRMILTAAGMCTELFIAAIALLLWFWVEPGYLRDALFSVVIIGGLTTVLFNANPLLKFDGYYLLQDALEIPNLSARASAWLHYLFKSKLLGLDKISRPYIGSGESRWLTLYGLGVILYKPILTLTIVVFLWRAYPLLGVLLTIFAVLNQWLLPAIKGLRWVVTSDELRGQRARALGLAFVLFCVLTSILLIPMPSTTRVQGVVAASEQGEIFSDSGGVVKIIHTQPGELVQQGDKLVTLSNPSLERDILKVKAELTGLDADRMVSFQRGKQNVAVDHVATTAERERLKTNLDDLQRRANALVIKAQQDGTFAPLDQHLLPGRHIAQGERVGFVVSGRDWTIRTLIPEKRAAQLRAGVKHASVRLAESIDVEVSAKLLRETPAVTRQLPSAALSQFGGGTIVTDPFDNENLTSLKNLFELELVIPRGTKVAGLGQRALIRLEHPAEALLFRLWRATRSVWLTRAQTIAMSVNPATKFG